MRENFKRHRVYNRMLTFHFISHITSPKVTILVCFIYPDHHLSLRVLVNMNSLRNFRSLVYFHRTCLIRNFILRIKSSTRCDLQFKKRKKLGIARVSAIRLLIEIFEFLMKIQIEIWYLNTTKIVIKYYQWWIILTSLKREIRQFDPVLKREASILRVLCWLVFKNVFIT